MRGELESVQSWPERCSSPSLPSCSDAADLVVQGKGKFEELMVCSHEIAASTAQLVAASKVGTLCPVWQKHHCSPGCALGLPAGLLGPG